MAGTIQASSPHANFFNDSTIGIILFGATLLYCGLIVYIDSRKAGKFVISRSVQLHVMDGLTFATGLTISIAIAFPEVFSIAANNTFYIVVTSITCMANPLLNVMSRYNRVVD